MGTEYLVELVGLAKEVNGEWHLLCTNYSIYAQGATLTEAKASIVEEFETMVTAYAKTHQGLKIIVPTRPISDETRLLFENPRLDADGRIAIKAWNIKHELKLCD